jgi:3-deoxy-D-manno-octulosonic-acid transferase
MEQLRDTLRRDDPSIDVFATLPPTRAKDSIQTHPENARALRSFLKSMQPRLTIWLGGSLSAFSLQQLSENRVPVVAANASVLMMSTLGRGWLPGKRRALVRGLAAVLTVDSASSEAFVAAGAKRDRVIMTGPLQDTAPLIGYHENDRRSLAEALGTRPVWLAAGVDPSEVPALVAAHRQAARLAHRLLLIVVPRELEQATTLAEGFRAAGFATSKRTDTSEPEEQTQVYVADLPDELGLWYRIAPITYFGGSLQTAAGYNPFSAAALGSVVVHGRYHGEFDSKFLRLRRASASYPVASHAELGKAIANLLAVDMAATIAHAGWDVTSRGAEVMDQLVTSVRMQLDRLGV